MSSFKALSIGVILLTTAMTANAQVIRRREAPKVELTEAQKKQNAELAATLVTRAASSAKDLSDADRAFLYARLADASAKTSPEKALAWAEEAFQLRTNMPDNMQRGQVVMQATLAVSKIDIDRAMQMLAQIEAPRPRTDGQMFPDMRAGIATMVFQRYWKEKGLESLEAIGNTSRQMGEAGYYPYMALAPLVGQVARKDKERAEALATEALSFLSRRQSTPMENQHLAAFLRNASDFMPPALMKETLEKLVKDALNTKEDGMEVHTELTDEKGNKAEISGAAAMMLAQIMPIVRRLDPEWAAKLEKENEQIRRLAAIQREQANEVRTMARIGGPDGDDGPSRDMREEMQSMEVDALAARDPQQALKLSNAINDPVLRAASHAKVAGELNRSDPEQAAKLLRQAREAIAQAQNPRDKLMIIAGLAQAQAAMKDWEGFSDTLKRGLTLGEELFRKGLDRRPNAPVFSHPGYELMNQLVRVGTRANAPLTLAQVDDVRTPVLQSLLLVTAANALDPDSGDDGPGMRIEIED